MCAEEITAGLRIDVDTLRGTRHGVPDLIRVLNRYRIRATFFFSVGPDNMGRHLFRLLRPTFLRKMVRSRAASLYGWNILLRGTLWPGPVIGDRCSAVIRQTAMAGHEVGLHAWDHHRWQVGIAGMDRSTIRSELMKSRQKLEQITGASVTCSASPGWRSSDIALQEKEKHSFQFNSDCRGRSLFLPVVNGLQLQQPQVPTTLPTYDELVGRNGVTNSNYNDRLLDMFKPDRLNVLTIHAEVEGMVCRIMFNNFLERARERRINFAPLGTFVVSCDLPEAGRLVSKTIPGREGWLSCQE